MQGQKEVKVGGRYKHKESGHVYLVLNKAVLIGDAYQDLIVYQREHKDAFDQVLARSLSEFNEKFKLLD
jgi:hypothetical protein